MSSSATALSGSYDYVLADLSIASRSHLKLDSVPHGALDV
jgi:hypothetical protein